MQPPGHFFTVVELETERENLNSGVLYRTWTLEYKSFQSSCSFKNKASNFSYSHTLRQNKKKRVLGSSNTNLGGPNGFGHGFIATSKLDIWMILWTCSAMFSGNEPKTMRMLTTCSSVNLKLHENKVG